MKKLILITLLMLTSIAVVAQDVQSIDILDADTAAWRKEVFTFPLGFAPEINYRGVEEARFPQGWIKTESDNFWSYVFAWKIDYQKDLPVEELEKNIGLYYDGLMRIADKKKTDPEIQEAVVLFVQTSETEYIGKIRTFDAFATKKPLTLNAKVIKYDCPDQRETIIVFRLSPKPFTNEVWSYLNEVKISSEVCQD
ncbi:MAG: hypothetical protein AAFQ94_12400 [Bacteroidota bacterium]